jgi:hypothetical protein
MKKKIRISVFLFPWEIDLFQDTVDRLKIASTMIDKSKYDLILDVTLNTSIQAVDWQSSKIDEQFFINSFNKICEKAKYFFDVECGVDDTTAVFGCVDKRRESIKKSNDDEYIIWLDLDIFFPNHILYVITQALDAIADDYFILTPQIVKMWDSSWDILTNTQYMDNHPHQRKRPGNEIFNAEKVNFVEFLNGNIQIKNIPQFKFAGGWFNVFSSKLLKLINIPESFGSYGLEDTYILTVCNICQQLKYPVNQYILENVIVGEFLYECHGMNFDFKSLLNINLPSKEIQLQQSRQNFDIEIRNKITDLKKFL